LALLNALINTAAGASWVSIHNGGGVGIGFSQHAGMVVVADGTDKSKRRLSASSPATRAWVFFVMLMPVTRAPLNSPPRTTSRSDAAPAA